ncbi:MAG: hypothetical protein A2Y12_11020 [Planctomycetes bacterium GWF2_42_9]|nr:MAG: hypothetical protein A2Y12_11020 [Planctomycetes bacterium GWF2_42_9]HAL45274.1 hypothetical protein [Phycisphaerales bacterium]
MSTISLPGLTTGIDTTSIISQLVTIKSQGLARHQLKQASYTNQLTALDAIKDEVASMQTATKALADAKNLKIYTGTSSDSDKLTVTVNSNANPGSHTIDVKQLATTETWIQDNSNFTYETDYVGEGVFIYTYGHQSRSITTVANETTLQDLVNLINNDSSNPGVTASTLYYNGSFHLMLSGQNAGENYQISIDNKLTETWKGTDLTFTDNGDNASSTTKITSLDQFSYNNEYIFEDDEKIIISGTNHHGSALKDFELNITSNTTLGQVIDAINEQFDGVATAKLVNGQIWISDNMSGESQLSLNLSYSPGSSPHTLSLPTMKVSQEGGGNQNVLDLGTFTKTQSAQSALLKVDGFPSGSIQEVQKLTFGSSATGYFTLSYNGKTTNAIDAAATASQVQNQILSAFGLNEGDITVEGDSTTGFTFTFNTSFGDTEKLSVNATGLAFSGTNTAYITEETKGSNGYIERSSNNITNVISGVTLQLSDVTEAGNPVKITVSRNVTSLTDKINKVVSAYNTLIADLIDKTEYNSETKTMGILSSNTAVSYIKNQFKMIISSIASGFTGSSDAHVRASDIGLTLDGKGYLQFDADVFNNATDEDFACVLDLLGATKTSTNETGVIQYYNASNTYTKSGLYNVQVEVKDNQIISAKIKLSSESEYRDATWSGSLITGLTKFTEGKPNNPENSLQLTVDLTQSDGTYNANIAVKEGIMTNLYNQITDLLSTDGRMDLATDALNTKIDTVELTIEKENDKIDTYEKRLKEKYARLEKVLTDIQQQYSSISQLG